jgi:hypothetical protein
MRSRADLRRLPTWARYAIALAVLAMVLAVVLLVRPDARTAGIPTWYLVVVRIGAVGLFAYLAIRLVLSFTHRR